MSKILNKIPAMIALVFVLATTGCLKDSDYDNNWIGTKNTQAQDYVEVHLTTSDNSNIVARAYTSSDKDTTVTKLIPINLTSGPASSDITVTFEVLDTAKSATLKSFVEDDGDVVVDTSAFKILNAGMKVTIPAGSQTGYIAVKFKPSVYIGTIYVFGIKLTSVSNSKYTLSNLTEGYVKFSIKNIFDGIYTVDGSMIDMVNSSITGAYPFTAQLITQTANSVALFEPNYYGDYYHLILSGGGYSVYGKFSPVFTFDDNYNVTSVVNLYGQPSSNNRSAELDPSGINKFDPATKTLKVKYWMNQPGHRTSFDETFTYQGPRP